MDEEVDERDTLQRYGPYEYHRSDNDEPMFRQWKIRNLASLFENEKNSREYTLEQFKDWFKRTVNSEDWSYIRESLDDFSTSMIDSNEIYEYLFQLGMNPEFVYSCCLRDIEYCEERLKEPNYKYKEYVAMDLKRYRERLNICEKYISPCDKRIAISLKDTVELY
jgi:hypothetical protein